MRSTDSYTVPEDTLVPPKPEEYRRAYSAEHWIVRALIRFETVLRGKSVDEVVQHREFRALVRRLSTEQGAIVDTTVPALRDGALDRLRTLSTRMQAVRPALREATGARAGAFLLFLLSAMDEDAERRITQVRSVPSETLRDLSTTVKETNTSLRRTVQERLDADRDAIAETVESGWRCILALKRLSDVPFRVIVPDRSASITAVPITSVLNELVSLHRAVELCIAHRMPDALRIAGEFLATRSPRPVAIPEDLWSTIEGVRRNVPLRDLIRLGLGEPRMDVVPVTEMEDWWPSFERFMMSDLDAEEAVLKYRVDSVEAILRDSFLVTDQQHPWLPVSLYRSSVDAVQRLSESNAFRRTRLLAGTLAREEEILPGPSRKTLLDAHVQLDQRIEALESLVGRGERPGTIAEAVRRAKNGTGDKARLHVELTKLFAGYRDPMHAILEEALDALASIQRICSAERKAILRRLPRLTGILGDSFGDLSLRYVVDLLLEEYQPLHAALAGLVTVEHEVSAPLETEDEELDAVLDAAADEF